MDSNVSSNITIHQERKGGSSADAAQHKHVDKKLNSLASMLNLPSRNSATKLSDVLKFSRDIVPQVASRSTQNTEFATSVISPPLAHLPAASILEKDVSHDSKVVLGKTAVKLNHAEPGGEKKVRLRVDKSGEAADRIPPTRDGRGGAEVSDTTAFNEHSCPHRSTYGFSPCTEILPKFDNLLYPFSWNITVQSAIRIKSNQIKSLRSCLPSTHSIQGFDCRISDAVGTHGEWSWFDML